MKPAVCMETFHLAVFQTPALCSEDIGVNIGIHRFMIHLTIPNGYNSNISPSSIFHNGLGERKVVQFQG